jgi:hypothetical protein
MSLAAVGSPANGTQQANRTPPELTLWVMTRLAEMAIRLQRPTEAQRWFDAAFKLGITDQFLLGAYADFLLAQQRPAEVLALLANWERSDVLLLRLALAGKATGDQRAKNWATQMQDRLSAAAQRGDRLHEQEAARFELDVQGQKTAALAYASRNYEVQKEPRDAHILLRAALAAGDGAAAAPALAWLKQSGYQDPALAQLAQQLSALPGGSSPNSSSIAQPGASAGASRIGTKP